MSKLMLAISNHSYMLGGGEYSFLDLLSSLPQNWHVLAALPEEGELALRLRRNRIKTCIIPLPSLRPWFIFYIIDSLRACYKICSRTRPELIYANGSRAAFYGGIIGRVMKIPVIWHCRVAESDPFLDWVLKRSSHKIIVNSRFAVNRFSRRFHQKVEIAYNGVNLDWLKEESLSRPKLLQEEWRVILMVARVSRSKRHDLAIMAFENLARCYPEAHLVCLGSKDPMDPYWWEYLQQKTIQSPFYNRIHWEPEVRDVRPWYQAATLSILPADMESFGRVLVESMACGVPVVATRCGGIPEIVRHGQDGFLVSPGSVNGMAKAMLRILKNEEMRKRFAHSATKRAETFSLGAHVEKMVRLFEDAVQN